MEHEQDCLPECTVLIFKGLGLSWAFSGTACHHAFGPSLSMQEHVRFAASP